MQSSNRIINYVAIHTLFWIRLCAGSNRYIIFRCKWIKCICMYEIYLAWKVYLFLLLIGARYRQYFPVLMCSIIFIIYIKRQYISHGCEYFEKNYNIIKYNITQIFHVRMHVKQKSSCAWNFQFKGYHLVS